MEVEPTTLAARRRDAIGKRPLLRAITYVAGLWGARNGRVLRPATRATKRPDGQRSPDHAASTSFVAFMTASRMNAVSRIPALRAARRASVSAAPSGK